MKLKRKLFTLIALPLFGFLCLGLFLGNENYKIYKNLQKTENIVIFSTKVSQLIHELQKERGYSAGYLGTNGTKFRNELKNQQVSTNKKQKELFTYLQYFNIHRYNEHFKEVLTLTIEKLSVLKEKRQLTQELKISSSEIISYYSDINKLFLDTIAQISKNILNTDLNRQFSAYEQFSRLKDAAGVERAIGTHALSQSFFDEKMRSLFQNLIYSQKIYFDHFKNYATFDSYIYLKEKLLSQKITEIDRIQENLLAANFSDSENYWFEITTYKIDKLKEVDTFLLDKLSSDIVIIKNEFKYSMYYFISFCLLIALVVIIVGHYISRNINNLFRELASKIDIFFKYINKEVQDVSLFDDDIDNEIISSSVVNLNNKILKSKELLIENNKFLDEALSLSKLYEYAIERSNLILRVSLDKQITYANESYCKISEYKKEELIGQPYSIIKHPDVKDYEITRMWKFVDEGNVWKGTLKNISKTGKTHYSVTTIVPIKNKEGKILEYMGIRQDITEVINLHKEIEDTQREVIYKMGEIAETRSPETGYHVRRVAEYTKLLAIKAGLPESEANLLKHASPMHDIGKVGIPDSILNKPGKLTEDEFEIMKDHAQLGYDLLKNSNRPMLQTSAIVASQHHEKYDGTGYPNGLKGREIHIYGRISAICDVFDALGSERSYKKAWEMDKILEFIREGSGTHFDPHLTNLFLDNIDEFLKIKEEHDD